MKTFCVVLESEAEDSDAVHSALNEALAGAVGEIKEVSVVLADEACVCPKCGLCLVCGRPYPAGWAHVGGDYMPHPPLVHACQESSP